MSPEELFAHVVEAGSFKRAAEKLGIEPSSVSRKVASLESQLGVKLLLRSTRHTRPTELGERYYEGLSHLISEKAALDEEISSSASTLVGTLRISAPVDFGSQFVVPVVRELQASAPDLSVDLLLGSSFFDLAEQGIDVAIRIGELADSRLVASKLGQVPRILAASKNYLNQNGTPTRIDELDGHEFVLYAPSQGRRDIQFANGEKLSHNLINSRISVNSVSAIRQLVRDGAGIHWGPKWMFRELLHSGEVVQVLPKIALKSFPAHALYQSRTYVPRKVREFIDLLRSRLIAAHALG